jgi:hypothetical protein
MALHGCRRHTVIHSPYEGVGRNTFAAGSAVTAKPLADGGRVYLGIRAVQRLHSGEDGTADLIGNTDWSRGYPLRDYDAP